MTTTGYRDHTVIGLPDHVAHVIANHHRAGTLISLSPPRPVSPTDPRVQVALRLVDTTTPPATPPSPADRLGQHAYTLTRTARQRRRRRRITITTTVAVTAIGVIAAIGYAVAQLVAFLTEHAAVIAGGLIIAAILTALAFSGSNGRRHCPGC
jgi:hypothetical protein